MKTTAPLLLALLAVGAFSIGVVWAAQDRKVVRQPPGVLRHVVLYKFKNDLSPTQIQEVVEAFSALPTKIEGIVDFEHGVNVSPEGKSDGLTHAFVVSFRDEAARDAYLKHPAHDAYVAVVKDRREKVVVFDYWTAE